MSNSKEKRPYGARRTVTGMPIVPREVGIPYMQTMVGVVSSRDEEQGSLIARTIRDNPGFYDSMIEAITLISRSRPLLNFADARDIAYLAYTLIESAASAVVEEEYKGVVDLLAELKKTRASSEMEKQGLRARITESFNVLLGKETKRAAELDYQLRKAYRTMGALLTRAERAEANRDATSRGYRDSQKKIARLQAKIDELTRKPKTTTTKGKRKRELTDEEKARRDALRYLDQEEDKNGRYLVHHRHALDGELEFDDEPILDEEPVRGRPL